MHVSPTTETNVQQAVPLFSVNEMDRSLRFYVDGLGFRVTKRWVDGGKLRWCWLELGNAAVMLQQFWKEGPHRSVADARLGVGLSINFICADAIALWREFTARGLDAKRPFVGNQMWVTQLADPDGYQLYFESPTDAPEETTFTGD
jgi:lactoylglutathione lyase